MHGVRPWWGQLFRSRQATRAHAEVSAPRALVTVVVTRQAKWSEDEVQRAPLHSSAVTPSTAGY